MQFDNTQNEYRREIVKKIKNYENEFESVDSLYFNRKEANILTKFQKFTIEVYITLNRFPRIERNGIISLIKSLLQSIAIELSKGIKSYTKKTHLYTADALISTLRINLGVALELKYIPFKRHSILEHKLTEIARMLGGWIKSVQDR